MRNYDVQKEVESRGIKLLLHFTKLQNLASILKSGIVPRQSLESGGVEFLYCDESRLDREISASCLSICHPNYKMFYNLRMRDAQQQWVVVACKPAVLWEKDCAFCVENAAGNSVTSIPIAQRKGVEAFNAIFAPVDGKPLRTAIKLPDACPTNPQAEVLVFDVIEPEYFIGVGCNSTSLTDQLKRDHPMFAFAHMPALFSARIDFQHWK
jgi:hypothetical protein